jgi:hypothetical protein
VCVCEPFLNIIKRFSAALGLVGSRRHFLSVRRWVIREAAVKF